MAKVNPGPAMDTEFLKRTVGEPLSQALTLLVVAQPADPIEFIGEALLDYIKRREAETKVKPTDAIESARKNRYNVDITRYRFAVVGSGENPSFSRPIRLCHWCVNSQNSDCDVLTIPTSTSTTLSISLSFDNSTGWSQ